MCLAVAGKYTFSWSKAGHKKIMTHSRIIEYWLGQLLLGVAAPSQEIKITVSRETNSHTGHRGLKLVRSEPHGVMLDVIIHPSVTFRLHVRLTRTDCFRISGEKLWSRMVKLADCGHCITERKLSQMKLPSESIVEQFLSDGSIAPMNDGPGERALQIFPPSKKRKARVRFETSTASSWSATTLQTTAGVEEQNEKPEPRRWDLSVEKHLSPLHVEPEIILVVMELPDNLFGEGVEFRNYATVVSALHRNGIKRPQIKPLLAALREAGLLVVVGGKVPPSLRVVLPSDTATGLN